MLLNITGVAPAHSIRSGRFYRSHDGILLLGMPAPQGKPPEVVIIRPNHPQLRFSVAKVGRGSEPYMALPPLRVWVDPTSSIRDSGRRHDDLGHLAVTGETPVIVSHNGEHDEIYVELTTGNSIPAPDDALYFTRWKLLCDTGRHYETVAEFDTSKLAT